MREDVSCTGTSFFKQTKQNRKRIRIEGGEALLALLANFEQTTHDDISSSRPKGKDGCAKNCKN